MTQIFITISTQIVILDETEFQDSGIVGDVPRIQLNAL